MFVTAVCWVGSKSLSHVLACIERVKDRLLDIGAASEAAKAQIITAVMSYWQAHPGVALSIIEKLLNYSILTPSAVVEWALGTGSGAQADGEGAGDGLAKAHVYELVHNTVNKVTGRVRLLVAPGVETDEETKTRDVQAMRQLFKVIEDAVVGWASGSKDQMLMDMEGDEPRDQLLRHWGQRWLRVFRRKSAIEEAHLLEVQNSDAPATANNGA